MNSRFSDGFWLLCICPLAQAQVWQHAGPPAQVIELFTSQGCSSCPPADRFTHQLGETNSLWETIIPVAYHVDYWDYLGWKDAFSNPAFSLKQRLYHQYDVLSSVYTPGFVVDGKEWRGFFSHQRLPEQNTTAAKALKLTYENQAFTLDYAGEGRFVAHFVLMAMDETTPILRGENAGKVLTYNHVVLDSAQSASENRWSFSPARIPANADAVAAWLTRENSFVPVQTVAGWLTP
ncbi:DUF1223 domain-containing protein (plasmid) [Photobacterium sp. GJ3]|nr:DUF1223 domain-containing protein [Photobacterium sp. GJ3]